MIKSIIILLAYSLLLGPGDGKKKGRKGNVHYTQEQYEEAVTAYRNGISSVQESGPGQVYSGLLNNLGAALYRSGDAEQAGIAFSSAARMAMRPEDMVRASYNAGNAAATNQELEAALEHYRRALLNDPSNSDAKFNYEFVKRQMEEQEQQEQDQENQDQDQDQNEENQDEQQDQNQENQDEQQENQNQENESESQDQNQEQQEQNQQEREDPTKLSEEEAERILQALENEEEQLLRQVQKMKSRPRRVEKDW
ncbi:MAG: tetratricopeptide repeat protein [Bacteroidetes Order II. Incertae sedis bacterium]|jgi:Ca-activated chloride channel homolog|nr:tetratricopeptide repeat protein [Bacteroidetes Order II. bacterium]MBT5248758.1 tetratricopeptide repeat protein [Bacteroidetes Order II. bacterium]MBT6201045.1 tetratricopeptide repeat protein [Bacteroidetes Order II. bacterium]MBT6425667.1 tetratricopeptide repeat protein [Bacteroidetes Order II. bacterium]MBT6581238.1 tetratricopeptide repeat protein [Bacteroidetes Order II. bacterium]